jgi:sugar O-acyltransferase (sialic acid O-acetyltransferase NeuD family)
MKDIIILGSGGHAKVVIDILERMNKYRIIGVTSVSLEKGSSFLGYPVLGDDTVLPAYKEKGINLVAMGLGGYKNNDGRRNLYFFAKEKGFQFVNAIHSASVISNSAILGEGVTIFAGVILNTEVKVGNNVIVATGSTVDHETVIEDHVLVSAGVTIGAYVHIKEGALLALGSKIISGIQIGKDSLIAAGAVVVNNLTDNSRVYGIPAK